MPEIKISRLVRNIVFGLLFFALGRLIVIQMGNSGIWLIFILVAIFYVIWWARYQRDKGKK